MAYRKGCKSSCTFKKCKRKRACACAGSTLGLHHPRLEDIWAKKCGQDHNHHNKYPDPMTWVCETQDPVALFKTYKIAMCGYDPTTSPDYKNELDLEEKEQDESSRQTAFLVAGVSIVASLLFRNTSKIAAILIAVVGLGLAFTMLPKDEENTSDNKQSGDVPKTEEKQNEQPEVPTLPNGGGGQAFDDEFFR